MHEWDIDRCRYVVYTWENGLLVYLCVCERERERERSICNTTTISLDSSVPRTIACNTCINAHILTPSPGPCPPQGPHIALYLARTISSWKPYLACSFPSHTHTFLSLGLFSLNIWHTHTHSTQHTHTPSPEHTIHPHPRLYGDHSRSCFFAPQHAQQLNLQRGHRADRRRRPHRARECGVIWKQGDVTTADWLLPPPSLSCTKLPTPLSPAQSIPQPMRSFPSRPCFSSSLIKHVVSSPPTYTESRCTRISCILHVCIFLTDLTSSSLFLSLSLCLVRFVSYSLVHIHTIVPALSAPSSKALSARFIHTMGYVKMLLL